MLVSIDLKSKKHFEVYYYQGVHNGKNDDRYEPIEHPFATMQGLHDFKVFVNPFSRTRRNLVV